MLVVLTFYWSRNPKKKSQVPKKYEAARRFPTLIINNHNLKDHVTLNTDFITEIKNILKYIQIENCYFKLQ